jgi:hypothetical protein
MFEELYLYHPIPWAIAAVVIACGLGFLPKSCLRKLLITGWTLLPVLLVIKGFLFFPSFAALPSLGLLLSATLLPWAALTLLSYNLVRQFTKINASR